MPAKLKIQKTQLIFILLLILLVMVIFFAVNTGDSNEDEEGGDNDSNSLVDNITDSKDGSSSNSDEKNVTISQANISALQSHLPSDYKVKDKDVYYYVDTMLNLTSTKDIKSLKIEDISFSKSPSGSVVKILAPRHTKAENGIIEPYYEQYYKSEELSQIFEGLSSVSDISFNIVEQAYPEYYDEFGKTGGFARFRVLVYNAGEFNQDEIMERDGVFSGSEVLEYAQISAGELSAEIKFEVKIEFVDGTKTSKEFSKKIDGESWLETGWLSNVSFNLNNTKF